MKRLKLIFLISNLICFCNIYSNDPELLQLPDYPKYKVVLTKFLVDYSISEIIYPNQFYLAKKPDGWHAIVMDMGNQKMILDELFWERENKKYRKINFPTVNKHQSTDNNQTIINDWGNNYFTNISPYWGYFGWDKDVISEYENYSYLSDTLLNALARAYCSYASNLLSNSTGFSSKYLMYNLPKGQNALSNEQLTEYRKYEHKAIDTYYKLWQTNPAFETFVADAYNVYSNEIMNSYLTILYFQDQKEAKKELRKGLYDKFFIDIARRYLASCDSNAILIVNGDSDTYPLLYIQESEGFRKDVTVINISLLNSGRYISHLFQNLSGREPINCKLAKEIYRNESKQFFYIIDKIDSAEFKTVIDFVSSTDINMKIESNGIIYDYIPTKRLIFKYNIDSLPKNYIRSNQANSSFDSTILIELKNYYLSMNHFCFLDIFSTNKFIRPIYFAITVADDNFLDLNNYFQCEGITYKITPFKCSPQNNKISTGMINTDIQYKKLIELTPHYFSDETQKYYKVHKMMIQNYRITYGRLAEKLIDENKKDSALNVLNYCMSFFPSEKAEHNYYSISLIESFYKINYFNEANHIVKELLQTTLNEIEKFPKKTNENDYEVEILIQTLKRLKEITILYTHDSSLSQTVISLYNLILKKYN